MSSAVTPLQSTVARWFIDKRGMMTGLVVAGIGVGTLVVPPVANWMIASYDWRTSYVVVGITALVLMTSAAQFLRRDPAQMGQSPYDKNGEGININTMSAGFHLSQALRTKQFWLLVASSLCFTMGEGAIMVHIVTHARGLDIAATGAAFILTIIGGISIAGRVTMGAAGDRVGNKVCWIICLALGASSFFWLLFARELWALYLFAVVFGFAYGGFSVILSPMVAEQFGLRSHGVIFGVIIMFGGTGGMAIGPLIAGHLFDVTGSYTMPFLMFAVSSVIGLILILFLRPAQLGDGRKI